MPTPPPLTQTLVGSDGKPTRTWADYFLATPGDFAPNNAEFITTATDPNLVNAVDLGSLPTGFLFSTVASDRSTVSTKTVVPVANGGTGIANLPPLDGQLLLGVASDGTFRTGVLTAGVGMQVTRGAGTLTVAQTLPALTSVTPADPTGTVSAIGVMMGLAIAFTPTRTGRALVIVGSNLSNTNAGGETQTYLRFGTGTAPANGAALTGTIMGAVRAADAFGIGAVSPCSLNTILTGLALGVAIWIDVALVSVGGGTANFTSVAASVVEI